MAGAGAGMKVCGDDRSAQHQSTNRNARGYLEVGISETIFDFLEKELERRD